MQQVADKLSNDIRSIMLNAGGPTAARTIYPIIDKNYHDLGFLVAVEPSQITVDSIKVSQVWMRLVCSRFGQLDTIPSQS